MAFKDHFSRQAAAYSRYRPAYPSELIAYVASLAPSRGVAIDCATGSGQAAVALAGHFERVIAVDGSVRQLAQSLPADGVHYVAALAERMPVRDGCAALVAAAQAAHWFDFERFYPECRRVLGAGGVVAVWTYEKFHVDAALDAVVDHFYSEVVGPWWPAGTTLRRGRLPGSAVSAGRGACASLYARDGLGPRPGARLLRQLVGGAALP